MRKHESKLVRRWLVALLLAGGHHIAVAQTRVDLVTQSRGLPGQLKTVRTSNTVLTVGSACTASAPCKARVGGAVYSIENSATITLSGSGNPTVRIYLSDGSDGAPAGTLKVRNTEMSGISCSAGCIVENGQASMPGMSIPLSVWASTSGGSWGEAGTDLTTFLDTKPSTTAGTGIMVAQDASDRVAIDTTLVPKKYAGSGPPANIPGSLAGDLYIDAASQESYQCLGSGPCNGVDSANWVKLAYAQPALHGPWFILAKGSGSGAQNPSLGAGKSNGLVLLGRIETQTRQIARIAFSVVTAASSNCGSGSVACGMLMGILNDTRTSMLCRTEAAYGGNPASEKDINTTGAKSIGFVSGSNASGGICTLAAGSYWIAVTTDSNEIQIASEDGVSGDILSHAEPGNVLFGRILNGITGSGQTINFVSLNSSVVPVSSQVPVMIGIY